ncbi:MAG: Xaa-Pro peptidase family protein [Candidatus Thorarchaeota archaeon]
MQFTPQRLDKVHRAMRREEIDALLVTRRQDVQYLTGYRYRGVNVPIGCLITEDHQPQLVLPDRQELTSSRELMIAKIRPFNETTSEDWSRSPGAAFWEKITEILKEIGLTGSMIGLQHDRLSVREFEKLKQALPEAGFKDFSPSLWKLRNIKDAAEIDAIRQAVTIGEIGIRTALEVVETSKSEEEASLEIEAAMRGAGGQQRGIRAAVLSGAQAHLPFTEPGASRISGNDFVVLDIAVSHSGYFGEVARTIHLGKPSDKQKKLFKYVINAARLIEKRLKPEAQIKDVAQKTVKKLGKSFPPNTIVQPLGNSIGLDLYEPPYIVAEVQQSLREGMVFSIHPTGFAAGVGAVKIGDIVVITEDGCENLTTLARETM